MLLSLLPLAGWADPTLTVSLGGTGISESSGSYSATYKGAAYDPAITVKWGEETVTASTQWKKVVESTETNITADEVKNAGTYKLVATYTPQGYDAQTKEVTFTINKIAVTITAKEVAKTYGEADGNYSATVGDGVLTDETLTYTVGRADAQKNTTKAGTYENAIVVTADDNAGQNINYNITKTSANLVINKKAVTIAAKAKSITYGANVPSKFDYTIEGLVDADGTKLADNYLETSHDGITGTLSVAASTQESDKDTNSGKLKAGSYTIKVTAPTEADNYTFSVTNSTLTVNKATMYVKVENKAVAFGGTLPTSYDFEYESGLMSEAEITAFVENGKMKSEFFTNNSNDLSFSYNVATPTDQGEYTVSATGLTADNYKVLINTGKLTINKKSIEAGTATVATTDGEGKTYKYLGGDEVKPTVLFTLESATLDPANYEVVYKNNTKAYTLTNSESFTKTVDSQSVPKTEDEIDFPYVIITGKGNYTGTVKKAFGIAKAPLTIKAEDKEIALGGTPNYSATIGKTGADLLEANAAEIKTKLQNGETVDGFSNKLTYSALGGNNVGEYDITVGGLTADNYDITFEKGILTVNPGTLPLKVKVTNATYGTAVTAANNFTFEFDETGEGAEAISQTVRNNVTGLIEDVTYTIKDEEGNEVETSKWAKLSVGEYTVSATAENNDYTVNFKDAKLTVGKKELTITIVDQTVNLFDESGDSPVQNKLYGEGGVVKLDAVFYSTSLTDAYDNSHANGYTIKVEGLVDGEEITSLNIGGLASTIATVGEHADAITYAIAKDKEANSNYDYDKNIVKGKLTIKGLDEDASGVALTLENVASKIKDYDKQTVDVKVTFDPTVTITNTTATLGTSAWKAEKWYTMVLPFETTVAALSKAIGYAIVNVVNPEGTTDDNISFKLTMGALPANQPFMVKTASDITAPVDLKFEQVTIENTTAPSVDAGNNYTLVGTYGEKAITNADESLRFLFYHSDKEKTTWDYISTAGVQANIKAFNAWADLSASNDARSITFTFEELDGTTTVIKAAEFGGTNAKSAEGWYNLNGVKLQGAPTEKGVYIQNGKKVIVK